MMRLLGAVFIFAACLNIGIEKVKALNMRETELCSIRDSIVHIRNEIACRNDALPELFYRLSAQTQGQAGCFFESLYTSTDKIGEMCFSDIWEDAIKASFTQLCRAEYSEFSKLGQSLGRCDMDFQIKALTMCEAFFSTALEEQRHQLPQKRRLALGLSATAAAFVVILLI